MLMIYQIGNYRTNLVASSNQGIAHSLSPSFRNVTTELTGVTGSVITNMPGRPLLKENKWKVEGALLCGAQQTCMSVDQQFNRLIANGGTVVPIIGVLPPECCPCEKCGGSGCTDCSTKPESVWLLSYGVVTEYKSDYKQDFGQSFGMGELNVSMSIEGTTYWEPLNDISWKYYGRGLPIYPDMTVTTPTKHTHPFSPQLHLRSDSGFQYIVGNFMYDPANWVRAYSRTRSRRARALLTSADPTTPTITLSDGVAFTYMVDIPYLNWPAPPRSLYYFANLPEEGTITITVETLTLTGLILENTAVLDLAELAANIDLIGGISPADTLIAGILDGSYNGLYLLGGGTDANIYVPWTKTGKYPGETPVGQSTITVLAEDTGQDIDFAYLHIFRRY